MRELRYNLYVRHDRHLHVVDNIWHDWRSHAANHTVTIVHHDINRMHDWRDLIGRTSYWNHSINLRPDANSVQTQVQWVRTLESNVRISDSWRMYSCPSSGGRSIDVIDVLLANGTTGITQSKAERDIFNLGSSSINNIVNWRRTSVGGCQHITQNAIRLARKAIHYVNCERDFDFYSVEKRSTAIIRIGYARLYFMSM